MRCSLSYRDAEELLAERGLLVGHVTVWRWVQSYAPEIQRQLATGRNLHPGQGQVALPVSCGGFFRRDRLLSPLEPSRTRPQQKRFLAKALGQQNHPAPRVINTDGHAAYPPAIAQLKSEGALNSGCQHRPVPYLNNVLEQDHRAIKRRVNASQDFRSFCAAWRTLAVYEVNPHDPQRPGVRKCAGGKGRSAPSLYCWYVWN